VTEIVGRARLPRRPGRVIHKHGCVPIAGGRECVGALRTAGGWAGEVARHHYVADALEVHLNRIQPGLPSARDGLTGTPGPADLMERLNKVINPPARFRLAAAVLVEADAG
jgi:hypothetical protein